MLKSVESYENVIVDAETGLGANAISLIIDSPRATAAKQPTTIGIPFPKGMLFEPDRLLLCDPCEQPVELQTTVLARWSDHSIRWLLFDFILGPTHQGSTIWPLVVRDGEMQEQVRPEAQLDIEEVEQGLLVRTGSATFTLDRDIFVPIVRAELDGLPVVDATRTKTVLVNAGGGFWRPLIERHEIESRGPVRASVRFEGAFEGRRRERCRFFARLSFFSGLSVVRVDLTLHNPRRARHRGGLWDLGDAGSTYFRDLSLQLGLSGPGHCRIHWNEEVDGPVQATDAESFEIYQDSSGGENWQSRNHVNRFGKIPCRFRGYRVTNVGKMSFGLRQLRSFP